MYVHVLCIDPPQVSPFDQSVYVRNESDSFTLECRAFGIPLPALYWIPTPLKGNPSMEATPLTTPEEIKSLLAKAINSRFENLSSLCPVTNGPSSVPFEQPSSFALGCSPNQTFEEYDCTIPEAICPVPCGVSIANGKDTNQDGTVSATSTLTICNLDKADKLSYTCLAVNNITNVVDTPETATANLIVQGKCSTTISSLPNS